MSIKKAANRVSGIVSGLVQFSQVIKYPSAEQISLLLIIKNTLALCKKSLNIIL